MDITTGREFSFTNPQDDPHLYAQLPPGLSYNYDGTVRGVPSNVRRPGPLANRIFPPRQTTTTTTNVGTISSDTIQNIILNGRYLPNARGPGKTTYCDACQTRGLKRSIAWQNFDLCFDCVIKYGK